MHIFEPTSYFDEKDQQLRTYTEHLTGQPFLTEGTGSVEV